MKTIPGKGLKLYSSTIQETLMVLKQEKKDVVQFCERSEILLLVKAADFKKMVFAFLDFEYVQRWFLPFRGLSYTQSCTSNIHSEIQSWKVAENLPEKFLAWRPWASHRRFYEPLEIQHIPSFVNECELVFSGEGNLIFHQIFRDFYPAHQKKKLLFYIIFSNCFWLYSTENDTFCITSQHTHTHRWSWNQVFVRLF